MFIDHFKENLRFVFDILTPLMLLFLGRLSRYGLNVVSILSIYAPIFIPFWSTYCPCNLSFVSLSLISLDGLNYSNWTLNLKKYFKHVFPKMHLKILKLCHFMKKEKYYWYSMLISPIILSFSQLYYFSKTCLKKTASKFF